MGTNAPENFDNKLIQGMLLQVWSPPDPSARDMLLPWKQVWSAAAWKDITARTVVPQLEAAMHHVLNLYPHQLNIAPCEWCSALVELLSTRQLAGEHNPTGHASSLAEILMHMPQHATKSNLDIVSLIPQGICPARIHTKRCVCRNLREGVLPQTTRSSPFLANEQCTSELL